MPARRTDGPPYEVPPPYRWWGFDYESTCNLCSVWQPSPHSDERLLELEPFTRFVSTAALYRDPSQGRVLVEEWARRRDRSDEVEHLLRVAELA